VHLSLSAFESTLTPFLFSTASEYRPEILLLSRKLIAEC
jgi:hypothetical protein